MAKTVVAICYDFDSTLSTHEMQYWLAPKLDMTISEFWANQSRMKGVDFVLSYLWLTIEECKKKGITVNYMVGTMIETPRAALKADEIAKKAEFFSFGTNDLTQLTYGFSRDDASKFLDHYYEKQVFENDPFQRIDEKGVGKLVETACRLGRRSRKDIELGICGEHGGEPKSVEFCHNIGLTYVSCSPYRVPIARLAAAQARAKELLEEE